jgi:hypothetical protein
LQFFKEFVVLIALFIVILQLKKIPHFTTTDILVGIFLLYSFIFVLLPIGSYDLITAYESGNSCLILEKYGACSKQRITDGEIEIMPEGWSPETTSVKEDLIGRWVKALVDNPQSTNIKKGEIVQLLEKKLYNYKIKNGYGVNIPNNGWELLPADYSPDEIVPEYVECIKAQPQYNNYGELGKIYKVQDWMYSVDDCMLEGTTSGSTDRNRFKPSTKEAYDAQQSLKFKIGDWVVITQETSENGKIGQILSKEPSNSKYWIISNVKNPYNYNQIRLALPHEIPKENPVKSFPTNWCVKITDENREVLDAWRRQQPGFPYIKGISFMFWLISNPGDGTYNNWSASVPDGYTEITYEEFITNVHSGVLYNSVTSSLQDVFTDLVVTGSGTYYAGIDPYEQKKPLIENVHSISVNLRTKNKTNKLKF